MLKFYVVIIIRVVLPPAPQINGMISPVSSGKQKGKTKSARRKRNICNSGAELTGRPPFIICAQPPATCNCLKRASSQGKLKEKLPNIEMRRSASVSKIPPGLGGVGYYRRVWDSLVSEAARDIYNIETTNVVKPYKIY